MRFSVAMGPLVMLAMGLFAMRELISQREQHQALKLSILLAQQAQHLKLLRQRKKRTRVEPDTRPLLTVIADPFSRETPKRGALAHLIRMWKEVDDFDETMYRWRMCGLDEKIVNEGKLHAWPFRNPPRAKTTRLHITLRGGNWNATKFFVLKPKDLSYTTEECVLSAGESRIIRQIDFTPAPSDDPHYRVEVDRDPVDYHLRKATGGGSRPADITWWLGDEMCRFKGTPSSALSFRTYFDEGVQAPGSAKSPIVANPIPLGTGPAWIVPSPSEIKPYNQRKWLAFFSGSLTDNNRRLISNVTDIMPAALKAQCKLNFIKSWKWFPDAGYPQWAGYQGPNDYKANLLDSRFALVPMGQNPESCAAP